MVNSLIERKTASGEYKEHPDLPDDPNATLFHVLVDLDKIEEERYEERMEQEVTGTVDGEQAWKTSCMHALNHAS